MMDLELSMLIKAKCSLQARLGSGDVVTDTHTLSAVLA